MRPRSHVTQKERRRLTLSGFRGVDLTSNPLEVSASRATYMRNFISDGGVNHKRPGWREVYNFGERINGIFEYYDDSARMTIVQAGKRFYRIDATGFVKEITNSCTYAPAALNLDYIDPDRRSQGFMLNGALYIIGCGDFLVYEYYSSTRSWELRRVYNNETTYIPTTTYGGKGYGYTDANNKYVFSSSAGGTFLDDINLFSSKRKNSFIGYQSRKSLEEPEDIKKITYGLDSYIYKTDDGFPLIEIEAINAEALVKYNGSYLDYTFIKYSGTYTIRNSPEDLASLYEYKKGVKGDLVGGLNWIDTLCREFWLYSYYGPEGEATPNITVTFTPGKSSLQNQLPSIAKCAFGIRFGTEEIADRLFLGGDPELKNIDYYSEESDFTYFGELNTAALGDSSTSIEGYARLSDSSLVVYKSDSNAEPSFFYRTAKYYDEYDNGGNIQKMYGIFPHTEGSVGEGVASRYANANLCGDTIFLSKSGVHGIVLSDNLKTVERYMRERSRNIRSALAAHKDLSEAVGIVYNNRYYLAIDGICYVGDARYKFEAHGDIDGSYNYEWWVWDNIPARVWGKVGNDLYFGTADGRVCVFDDQFADRTYDVTEAGDLSIDNVLGEVVYNTTSGVLSHLCSGDRISFDTAGIYAVIGSDMQIADGRIFTTEKVIDSMHSGMTVYVGESGESGLFEGVAYRVEDIDRGDYSFILTLDGTTIEPTCGGFKLFISVSGKELYIADDPSDGRFALKETPDGEVLKLAVYNEAVLFPIATITHAHNVVAEWVTPVTDLGTNAESKTLVGLTLSARPVKGGKLSFGYETRVASSMIAAQGVGIFSLDGLSFMDFTFDTGFQSSYSVRATERNFNYIVFRFLSDSDTDCIINGLTVDYKINKSNKGVR